MAQYLGSPSRIALRNQRGRAGVDEGAHGGSKKVLLRRAGRLANETEARGWWRVEDVEALHQVAVVEVGVSLPGDLDVVG